jgi:light-regulated signal transduction histidine kinase (bacteriophytochrome)
MRNLLADLLTYAQAASGDRNTNEIVDLNLVFDDALRNLSRAIEENGAVITSDLLPHVRAHHAHFVQLIQNLVSNAIKYRSVEPPRIHLSVERRPDEWHFAMTDNGIGIEPQYHRQVFDAFKRLHGREVPGTGIGLAICKRVIGQCGGQIWIESEPGRGSAFCFTVPVVDSDRERNHEPRI